MSTLANGDYLPLRDLRIWISAESGLSIKPERPGSNFLNVNESILLEGF
jgi:hypothetical protein